MSEVIYYQQNTTSFTIFIGKSSNNRFTGDLENVGACFEFDFVFLSICIILVFSGSLVEYALGHIDPVYELFATLIFLFTAFSFIRGKFIRRESGGFIACGQRTLTLFVLATIGLAVDLDTCALPTALDFYYLWQKEANAFIRILGLFVRFVSCDIQNTRFVVLVVLAPCVSYSFPYLRATLRGRFRHSSHPMHWQQRGRRGAVDLTAEGINPLDGLMALERTNRIGRSSAHMRGDSNAPASAFPQTNSETVGPTAERRRAVRSGAPSPEPIPVTPSAEPTRGPTAERRRTVRSGAPSPEPIPVTPSVELTKGPTAERRRAVRSGAPSPEPITVTPSAEPTRGPTAERATAPPPLPPRKAVRLGVPSPEPIPVTPSAEPTRKAELPYAPSTDSGRLGENAPRSPLSLFGLPHESYEAEDEDGPRPFRLTFGVEVEFILQYTDDQIQTWIKTSSREYSGNQTDTFLHCQIADTLNAAGIPTYDPQSNRAKAFLLWMLTNDASVNYRAAEDDENKYCGIEIKTPVYDVSDPNAKVTIRKAMKTLDRNFSIFINSTCGLHVHVGNRRDGFTLRTLKNLATLLLVFEPQLNSLHPWRRITNRWCETPGRNETYIDMTSQEKAEHIERIQTMRELVGAMSGTMGNRSVAYNFLSLISLSTVEFRIHSGSVDVEEIVNWVDFVTSLVNYAEVIEDVEIYKTWEPSTYTILDLMRMIGRQHLITYYKDRLHVHTDVPDIIPEEHVEYPSFTMEDLEHFNQQQELANRDGSPNASPGGSPNVSSNPPSAGSMSPNAGSQQGDSAPASRSSSMDIMGGERARKASREGESKTEAETKPKSRSSSLGPMETGLLDNSRAGLPPGKEYREQRYTYTEVGNFSERPVRRQSRIIIRRKGEKERRSSCR